jgi:hypothetical protein
MYGRHEAMNRKLLRHIKLMLRLSDNDLTREQLFAYMNHLKGRAQWR